MEDKKFLEARQQDELGSPLFPDDGISFCDFDDLITFIDGHENGDTSKIETKPNSILTINEMTLPQGSNEIMEKSLTKSHWKKKQVLIETMESQFNVFMWTKDEAVSENNLPKEPQNQSTARKCENKQSPADLTSLPNVISCLNCQKTFKDYPTLRKHMHIHGPRMFVCYKCGKSFVESSKLKRHNLVHSKEKPFQCSYMGCGKRFSLNFNLRTHLRIHLGIRPFVCPVFGCGKSFVQSTNLKTHMNIHSRVQADND